MTIGEWAKVVMESLIPRHHRNPHGGMAIDTKISQIVRGGPQAVTFGLRYVIDADPIWCLRTLGLRDVMRDGGKAYRVTAIHRRHNSLWYRLALVWALRDLVPTPSRMNDKYSLQSRRYSTLTPLSGLADEHE